jgi:hypothetical protein
VASALLLASWLFSVLAAERLHLQIRGAMCGYGVFHANAWGPLSIVLTTLLALVSGGLREGFAWDESRPRAQASKALALGVVVLTLLSALDLGFALLFLGNLDLETVVACCASGGEDAGPTLEALSSARTIRVAAIACGPALGAAIAYDFWIRQQVVRKASTWRKHLTWGSALGLLATCAAFGMAKVVIAPHIFESERHACMYCLLQATAGYLGYAIFGSVYLAGTSALGLLFCGALVKTPEDQEELRPFARTRLGRLGFALTLFLMLAVFAIARYAWLSRGMTLL